MSEMQPESVPQLCFASYRAEQIPGAVVVTGSGHHVTSGYKVFFQQSSLDIFPPRYSFWHVFPTGIVLEVITPFTEAVSFKTKEPVTKVVIFDADGRHEVSVDQTPDRMLKHAKKMFEKDGPFPM